MDGAKSGRVFAEPLPSLLGPGEEFRGQDIDLLSSGDMIEL
jgi:hypothetical protein